MHLKYKKGTEKNFSAAKLIMDLISSMGIKCIKMRPTNRKIDAAAFKKLSGITKRTNQEMRDAYVDHWKTAIHILF